MDPLRVLSEHDGFFTRAMARDAGYDDKAVSAMEIILDRRQPTAPMYVQLAALSYQAGQTRKAELASKKALELTPKNDREQIKAQLQAARTAASASLDAGSGSTSAPAG